MTEKLSLIDLEKEICLIQKMNPTFKKDAAFVFWFLIAYLTDSEEQAKASLTGKEGGKSGEKNIDAIFIDHKSKCCHIVQGKYHHSKDSAEKRNDVCGFAYLGILPWEDKETLKSFYTKLDPLASGKYAELVNCVKNKGYMLNLYYVSTGKCTDTVIDDASAIIKPQKDIVLLSVLTYQNVINTLRNYIDDITPHIPPLKLRIVSEGSIQHEGLIHRYDPSTKIESWVLSAPGNDIANMYIKVGKRIFAKNIRGNLGDTDINESIKYTIKKEPSNFWYYNNGITIVCSEARRQAESGEDVLIIEDAQIINGQQTTITLSKEDSHKTNLLVKIIKIPEEYNERHDYDKLINSIVRATNWQNYIYPSDLVSNDDIQIYLEKKLRQLEYQYIRKRMSKSEARSHYGQGYWQIRKEEFAQAVASCIYDPAIIKKGKEILFEDPYYKVIFTSKNINHYLIKDWLVRQVKYVAYGYSDRPYAQWHVLHFIWDKLSPIIGYGQTEKQFIYACEQDSSALNPLIKAIEAVFKAIMKYYRAHRKTGNEIEDIAPFFKRANLIEPFSRYWVSSANEYKAKYKENINSFKDKLNKIIIA